MNNPEQESFYATVRNQFGLLLGDGYGVTREIALSHAKDKAKAKLATANPNWRWRMARVRVTPVNEI